MMRPIAQMWC